MSEPYKVTRSRGAWRLQTFFNWDGLYPIHPIDAVMQSGIHVEKFKREEHYNEFFVANEDVMKAVALIRLNGIPVEVVE